jgi:magnesium chelatase family protein
MAPAEAGTHDLTLTIGILVASEQIKADIDKYIIMGELSLDGSLQPTRSVTYRHKS